MSSSLAFNALERRAVGVLGSVYALRMFGLFIVLPISAVAALKFPAANPILIGMVLGIPGLTQAIFQLPFGFLSDKFGRQPTIIGGLLIFVVGSFVAAVADNIYVLIAGRAIQGMGAVSAVVMAFASDLVDEQRRSKAMAFIGVGIGGAFILALVVGPPLEAAVGLSGVFLVSAGSGLCAILMIIVAFRRLPITNTPYIGNPVRMKNIIKMFCDAELLRLDIGVFILHLIMTANFLILPGLITSNLHLAGSQTWMFYLPVLVGGFLLMLPALILGEKKRCIRLILPAMVALLSVSQMLLFLFSPQPLLIMTAMLIFFIAFNYLEANLPALTSRFCPPDNKGVALGAFAQSQFLGIFFGGLLGGFILSISGYAMVYLFCAIVAAVWALLAYWMSEPPKRAAVPRQASGA